MSFDEFITAVNNYHNIWDENFEMYKWKKAPRIDPSLREKESFSEEEVQDICEEYKQSVKKAILKEELIERYGNAFRCTRDRSRGSRPRSQKQEVTPIHANAGIKLGLFPLQK